MQWHGMLGTVLEGVSTQVGWDQQVQTHRMLQCEEVHTTSQAGTPWLAPALPWLLGGVETRRWVPPQGGCLTNLRIIGYHCQLKIPLIGVLAF